MPIQPPQWWRIGHSGVRCAGLSASSTVFTSAAGSRTRRRGGGNRPTWTEDIMRSDIAASSDAGLETADGVGTLFISNPQDSPVTTDKRPAEKPAAKKR